MLQTAIFNESESLRQLGFEDREEINVILHLICSINEAISQTNSQTAFAKLKERVEHLPNGLLSLFNKSWKSYMNSTRGAGQNHPTYKYWRYIDVALDGYLTENGKSMREYLLQNEPGIRLEKSNIAVETDSDLYRALSILYPEIISTF